MNLIRDFRPAIILFGLSVTAVLPTRPGLCAENFSKTPEIEEDFRQACESTSLIHSLHYKMVFRSPELTKELEYWQKDSKYRIVAPRFHVHNDGSSRPLIVDGHTTLKPHRHHGRSLTYSEKLDVTSPAPIGLAHQVQFGWLFDDNSDCQWSLVQNQDVWQRALCPSELCLSTRSELLDGLPTHRVILYHSRLRHRMDVWLAETLGMYPIKIESVDTHGKVLSLSVVEKYEVVQVGSQRTLIPTLIRELRTSPVLADADPTYNIFEIINGSLEVNSDLSDELFVPSEEPLTEIAQAEPVPIREYRHHPTSEPELIPVAYIPPVAAAAPVIAALPQTTSRIPATVGMISATAACAAWSFRRIRSRNILS